MSRHVTHVHPAQRHALAPGSAAAPAIARSLALASSIGDRAVGAHPTVGGNAARLLVDTSEFVPAIVDDIRRARRQIHVTMFSWQDDGAGRVLGDLLAAKAREGVEVTVMVDGVGSRQWPFSRYRRYLDTLAAAGVQIRRNWHLPGLTDGLAPGAVPAVDHRKLFEIDGRVAYLGGMNLAKKYDEWHDVMVRLEGPVAALAGAELAGRWHDLGGHASAAAGRMLELAPRRLPAAGTDTVRLLGNSPKVELAATDEFFHLAATAKRRLWVETPYIGSIGMVRALTAAAHRGVDVRVVVPGPNEWKNGKFARPMTRSFYPDLVEAGVHVFEQPQMSHGKVWLADDVATVSSVNLDERSAKLDYEIGATIAGHDFVSQVERLFARDLDRSREVPPAEAHGLETIRRLRALLHLHV